MGKLYGSKTYLVGAMDRVLDGGVEWREKLTPRLHNLGVIVYNPCDKPIDNPKVIENKDGDLSELKAKVEALCDKHPLY